jgi:vacuolar-type H+-ATPase subunit I/STV1
MVLLFGYMDFLIVYKWTAEWPNPDVAPSIITTMINMPLNLGKTVHN